MKKSTKNFGKMSGTSGGHEKTSENFWKMSGTSGGHENEQIIKPKDSTISTNHVVQIKKF